MFTWIHVPPYTYIHALKFSLFSFWSPPIYFITGQISDFVHFPHLNKEVIEGNLRVEDYSLEKKIGEGQHSVVKLGAVGSGEKYAVKIIAKDRIRSVDGLLRLEKEINALVTLNPHPNIVNFKEAIHAETSLYLVMEHLPMDMFTFMDNFKAGDLSKSNSIYLFYHTYCIHINFLIFMEIQCKPKF